MVKLAKFLATNAHYGQTDKGGHPYILHPEFVVSFMSTEEEQATAWLHDVVEDTPITLDDLERVFPKSVVDAVDALTIRGNEDRICYLQRVKANPIAKKVKFADLYHNTDLSRITNPTTKDLARTNKYLSEMQYLMGGD